MPQAALPPNIPLEIVDFSGGLTDQSMLQDTTRYMSAINLWCTINKKLKTRPGSQIYNSTDYRTTEQARINSLIDFSRAGKLLIGTGTAIYKSTTDTAGANRLLGPVNSNAPFSAGTANANVAYSEWNGHVFLTNDSGARPIKVYEDSGGTMRVRTAGMPKIPNTANYVDLTLYGAAKTLAEGLRTAMQGHFTNTTDFHVTSDTVSNGLVDATSIIDTATLITVTKSLILAYANHFTDVQFAKTYHTTRKNPVATQGCYATVEQQTLRSLVPVTTLFEAAVALDDLKIKYNTHNGTVLNHKTVVLPTTYVVSAAFLFPTQGPSPESAFNALYAYANDLKSKYSAHISGSAQTPTTRRHPVKIDSTNTISAADATTPDTLATLLAELRLDYGQVASGAPLVGHYRDTERSATWEYHLGQVVDTSSALVPRPGSSSGDDINLAVQSGDIPYTAAALNEFRRAYNAHFYDLVVHDGGAPYLLSAEAPQAANINIGTWSYAFYYEFTYTVGDVTFVDSGAPLFKTYENMTDPAFRPMLISNIPTIINSAYTNACYDTATIKIKIYRTIEDGATFYYCGEVLNTVLSTTTTFTDRTTDAQIVLNLPLYTTGGVAVNTTPPLAKYMHIMDDVAYYLNVTDAVTAEDIPNRLQQSKAGDPDSCPGEFFLDFADDGKGINSVRSRLIVGTAKKMYRVSGIFDDRGNGGMVQEVISEGTGCVSHQSMVQAEEMLYFAGSDGFYMTNGFECIPLTDWFSLYDSLQNKSNIQGVFDPIEKRIHWAVQLESGSGANDAILTLDLNQQVGRYRACFTYATNSTSFRPTVVGRFSSQIIRGDTRGYMFKHDDAYTTDPEVDTTVNPSLWRKLTITHTYKPAYLNMGSEAIAKWGQAVTVGTIKDTNLSLDVAISTNLGQYTKSCKPILLRTTGYDQDTASGTTRPHIRHFPAYTMRFFNVQPQLTNNKAVIKTYETLGLASINATLKTLTLAAGSWATDDRNYFVAFQKDGFQQEFRVTAVASGVLTYVDAGNLSTTATGQRWVMRGYPKDEILHLQSVVLYAIPLQPQQSQYPGKQAGDL